MSLRDSFEDRFYSQFRDEWDNELFRKAVLNSLRSDSIVLDLGAGAGIVSSMNLKGSSAKVCGIDLDNRVLKNPYLDEAKIADISDIPYEDNTFDLVVSHNVLEHVEFPEKVFNEVNRVLKKGGKFIFKTPNKWHYMPLISMATPHWFHQLAMKWIVGRDEEDTFPTFYRINSGKSINNLAVKSGFEQVKIELVEGRPEYLRKYLLTYFFGFLYERLVNSTHFLRNFRILIIGHLIKR